jgi:hypothetical protein
VPYPERTVAALDAFARRIAGFDKAPDLSPANDF